MRKVLVVIIAVLSFSSSSLYASERFVTFPALGECTGTYVRYREDPDTESEILGRLNTPDRVIILGQTANNGEIWYEIQHPSEDTSAFVFGKYIKPVFNENVQRTDIYSLVVSILEDFGITPEREELFHRSNVRTDFRDNSLHYVETWNKNSSFGDIHINDTTDKLNEFLGEPDRTTNTVWQYREAGNIILTFNIKDDRITSMIFEY